jgi:putative nucleotidyltransferase with HDIG domain
MTENIRKTARFIKEKFMEADGRNDFDGRYRYEHTLRVAGIGQTIARAEGLDEEALVLACLLHDIGYVDCKTKEDHDVHGRLSARIAREYLTSVGLEADRLETICYGIKIHTEAEEEYERTPTPFEMSVADADNIDRFDAYRLYINLQYFYGTDEKTPWQLTEGAAQRVERYGRYIDMKCGTGTAARLWKDRIGFQLEYFRRLKTQMEDMKSFCDGIPLEI